MMKKSWSECKTPFEQLEYAKEAVRWLLDHESGLVDMHGIAYWADIVECKRNEIKKSL